MALFGRRPPDPATIEGMLHAAGLFWQKLEALKPTLPGVAWYPYCTLGNVDHMAKLLTGANRRPLELAGGLPVLDLGCGDGDLAFFLETLGAQVHAVDNPMPNHNGMRGVRSLKDALNSQVEIHSVDLDAQFRLPAERYGLAIFFGVLYHLKNPLYVMECLSRHANYCLLSTRIARLLPNGAPMHDQPLAYLVDSDELNADATNYWIFSEPGLRRLLKRSGWEVLDWMTVGERDSDPVHRDQRAFCLLRALCRLGPCELLEGWHEPEGLGWRWTERRFKVRAPAGARGFDLRLYVPDNVIARCGSLTLSVQAAGVPLAPETFSQEGEFVLLRALPETAGEGGVVLEFEASAALPPDAGDARERSLVVNALEFQTAPHTPGG